MPLNISLIGSAQTAQNSEQSGFAAAVTAFENHQFTRTYFEIKSGKQHALVAVALKLPDFQPDFAVMGHARGSLLNREGLVSYQETMA